MTHAGPLTVIAEVAVAAPAAAVWAAIADADQRRAWWPDLDLDARAGGGVAERWRAGGGRARTTTGRVVLAEPPHRLRCTWIDDDWPAVTDVELELRGDGPAMTRVRLTHTGWERLGEGGGRLRDAHARGWGLHLADLAAYAEAAAARDQVPPDAARDAVWARCAAQRGATVGYPFGDSAAVFKVAGRMFAVISVTDVPARVTLKCDPPLGAALCEEHPAISPGYHTDKRHWITATLDGSLEQDLLDDLVEASYDLVVAKLPKRTQAALGA